MGDPKPAMTLGSAPKVKAIKKVNRVNRAYMG